MVDALLSVEGSDVGRGGVFVLEVEVVEVDIRFADVYARGHSSLQQYLQ